MMNVSNKIQCLILDDKYGKISSHWAYSTEKFEIVKRIYYDEPGYIRLVEENIRENDIDVICFSGRLAVNAAKNLELYFENIENGISKKYKDILKIMKFHNTNLCHHVEYNKKVNIEEVKKCGNDWVQLALDHPFDLIFIQTYGDAEILNKVNKKRDAIWVPYSYNDKLYYDRKIEKKLDIGAFFKLERHQHRVAFINRIKEIADDNGYSFEFSDQYWGENYAKKISESKVIVHLSYCGDIPWRLYECAASGTCLLSDELKFGLDKLFPEECYVKYARDFSDLERKIKIILEDIRYRENIVDLARKSVQKYAWGEVVDNWIVPIIINQKKEKRKNVLYKSRRCS